MTHRRRSSRPPTIPHRRPLDPAAPPTLYDLEQFTTADLRRWNSLSPLLDELQRELYYGLESQRAAHREDLLAALQRQRAASVNIAGWVRIVEYQYCLEPLSPFGSVRRYGGRFNIGREVGQGSFRTFPALYVAENFETAFREHFQLEQSANIDGLSAEDFSLQARDGFLVASLHGRIDSVFDIQDSTALKPFVDIIGRFRLPHRVRELAKALKLATTQLIRSPAQLQRALTAKNWRAWPRPTVSQVLYEQMIGRGLRGPRFGGTNTCVIIDLEDKYRSERPKLGYQQFRDVWRCRGALRGS